MKKCTSLWREAHFEVNMYKTHHVPTILLEVEMSKSARRCGAKHISKSKCTKHLSVGPLLEVEMSKKCMPLWHEAHFQIKMYKAHQPRSTFSSCDVQNTPCSDHSWKLRCRKSARRCGAKHISKSKCEKHIKTPHVRATFGPCQK